MRDAPPTSRNVWLSGVLPTVAALLAAAVLLLERLQTDLSLTDRPYSLGVWWTIPVVFGLAHIWGVSPYAAEASTFGQIAARLAKSAGFVAAMARGWPIAAALLVVPLLLVGGFDGPPQPYENSPIYQVLVALPLMAWSSLAPGVCFGVLLALAAAPRWRSLSRADWKRLILAYAIGGVVATLILGRMSERYVTYYVQGDRNPLFDADHAWPLTLTFYVAVIFACAAIWGAALQAYGKSSNILKNRAFWSGLGSLAGFALLLAAATHIAAAKRITLFGDNKDKSNPAANFVRSDRPTLSPRSLKFHGVYFVGPRSVLQHEWDRLVLETSAWKPRPWYDGAHTGEIEVGLPHTWDARPPDCRAVSASRTVCANLAETNAALEGRRDPTAFEYDAAIPEAAHRFGIRGPDKGLATLADLRASKDGDGEGCRVFLLGVPYEGLQTEAWITCGNAWVADAQRLKALVMPWFAKQPR